MAYDNPGKGSAEEDMYSDTPEPKNEKPDQEEAGDEKTYLLPREVLEGKDFKPGDEVVLKIVSMKDDQVEVTYAPAKEQEKGEKPEGMAPEAPAGSGGGDQEMASMME